LKVFKQDLEASRQASVDMIEGMSKAGGRIWPDMRQNMSAFTDASIDMTSKLSDSLRQQEAQLKANDLAWKQMLSSKHDSFGQSTGGDNFAQLEASLRIQSDREYWTERAKQRDQNLQQEAQAERTSKQRAAQEALAEEDRAWKERLSSKHDALNQGSGGTNFAQLEASLRIQADREYWTERAKLRDQNLKQEIQAERIAAQQRRSEMVAVAKGPSFGDLMGSQRHTALYQDPMIQKFKEWQDQERAIVQAAEAARNFNRGNTSADNNMNNRGFSTARIMQQVGFGLQDFTSQVMNSKNAVDGIGRGIMAVSNNVQMLGSSFGATGLAVTAIGGALAGIVLPPLIKWATNSEELEKSQKRIEENYKAIAATIKGIGGMKADLENDDPKAVVKQGENLKRRADAAKHEQALERARLSPMRAEQIKLDTEIERLKEELRKLTHEVAPGDIIKTREAQLKPLQQRKDTLDQEVKLSEENMRKNSEEEANARRELAQASPLIEKAKQELAAKAADELAAKKFEDQGEQLGKRFEEQVKAREEQVKAREDIHKSAQQELENVGTPAEKLQSKHFRQEDELRDKLANVSDPDLISSARMALWQKEDVEKNQLKMDDLEDKIRKKHNAGSLENGVDTSTAEGVRAINRALAGSTGKTVEEKQLDQLKLIQKSLQERARASAATVVHLSGG
jgi:hypothetical protein